jgi:hypothetical protein
MCGTGDRVIPEMRAAYLVFVAWQIHGEIAVARIPHLERAVLAACDEQPAVGGPGTLVDLRVYVSQLVRAGC